jgi:diaminopimelate epimerase
MHGAGNDYIYVDTDAFPLSNPAQLATQWSAPHTGIGADGLVLISRSTVADFRMRIFNADGSEALMCGNASRCIGKYVYENQLTRNTTLTLETLSGIKELQLAIQDDIVTEVTVDMGAPAIKQEALTLRTNQGTFTGTVVSVGNPHFVIPTYDVDSVYLPQVGPALEYHPFFSPGRTNVEFAQVLNSTEVSMRVWERGSGITMACGTGACATAVACIAAGMTQQTVRVHMDGGALTIHWDKTTNRLLMTGDAVRVYEGLIAI